MRRGSAALAAVVVAVGVGVAGCSDEEPGRSEAVAETAAETAATGGDGTLTEANGRVIKDWGDPRERRESVAAFKAMTTAFREGRMDDACRYISDFALSQFQPGGIAAEAPCSAKLRAFARVVERKGGPPTVRIIAVRSYQLVSGVWVENERGRRIRVPLNKLDAGEGWKLELGVFPDPEILAARIRG